MLDPDVVHWLDTLLLNIFQSVEERYPFAVLLACEMERTFPVNESGAEADVMRFK